MAPPDKGGAHLICGRVIHSPPTRTQHTLLPSSPPPTLTHTLLPSSPPPHATPLIPSPHTHTHATPSSPSPHPTHTLPPHPLPPHAIPPHTLPPIPTHTHATPLIPSPHTLSPHTHIPFPPSPHAHRMGASWEKAQRELSLDKGFLFTHPKRILLFPGLVRVHLIPCLVIVVCSGLQCSVQWLAVQCAVACSAVCSGLQCSVR